MKRALGQEDPEEVSIPFLDEEERKAAAQPIFRPPYSEVLAGLTRPPGAPLASEVDVEEAPGVGETLLRTWRDIGDRLSAGSAAAVGGLARTVREVGQGLESTPVLSPLGGPLVGLGGELERFKGQEQETARRQIQQSASPDSLAGDVLEAVPGMVTTIGTGFVAGPGLAIPAATSMGGAQAFGGGMQQAEQAGASPEEALAYAATSAGAEMLTEQLGDVRLLRRVLEGVPGNQLTTLLKDMALGGAEEMAAETANSLARVMTYDESQTPAEALAGDVDQILRSGLVGAILQGAGTGIVSVAQEQAGETTPDTISPDQGGTQGSEEIAPQINQEGQETAFPPGIAELRDASIGIRPEIEAGYVEEPRPVPALFEDYLEERGLDLEDLQSWEVTKYRREHRLAKYPDEQKYEGPPPPAPPVVEQGLGELVADVTLPSERYRRVYGRRYQSTTSPGEFSPTRRAKYFHELTNTDNDGGGAGEYGLEEGGGNRLAFELRPQNPLVIKAEFDEAAYNEERPGFELPSTILRRADPEFLEQYPSADPATQQQMLEERGVPADEARQIAQQHYSVALDRVVADWARAAGYDFIISESIREGTEIVQLYPDDPNARLIEGDELEQAENSPVARIEPSPPEFERPDGLLAVVARGAKRGDLAGYLLVERDPYGTGYRTRNTQASSPEIEALLHHQAQSQLGDRLDAQDQEEAPPAQEAGLLTTEAERESPAPSLPARLVTRAGEAGFVQPRALARDIGKFLQRNFTVEGLLPKRVFERKVLRDGRLAKHSERLRVLATDLQKAIRKYKGPLSTEQLTRYLDDAYRGMNLQTGPELLDPTQIQRIATKRGVTPQSVEQAMLRARESKAGGLLQAPEFIPLIREMRVETEALTRQLRRQGLLTDGVARELERKYGLYVHRQYEAIRNPKWKERIEEEPIWERAVQLTTDRWNRRALAQRYDHVAKKLGLRRGQKTGLDDWEISQAAFDQSPAKLESLAQRRGRGQQFQEAMQEAEQLYPAKTPEQILGLLDNYIAKNSQPILPGGRPEGALDLSATFERDVLDELARSLLGEVRDVRSNLVTTVTKLATMVEQQAFLEDVARMGKGNFLYEEPVRIDGVSYSQQIDPGLYVKALQQAEGRKQDGPGVDKLVVRESKKRTDPLGGLYTSQDIIDELNKIYSSRSYQGFVRLYFGANVFVKAMKTIGSPLKSANRNLISNMSYALINGVVPGDLREFGKSIAKSHGRTAGWMPGSTNRERSARVQRYLELGLFDQGTDLGDIKAMESRAHIWKGEEAMQWAKKPGEAMEFLGRWYNAPDNVAKAYVFEKLLPRYRRAFPSLPVAEVEEYVAQILRDTMQNYSMVPRGIQELGQHTPVIAPFLSFWEEVIRNMKNAVLVAHEEATSDNPELRRIGRQRIAGLAAAASVPEIVSFAWKYLLNYDDEDEEAARRFMAPWNQNSQVMFLPPPKEGMVRYFDWGFIDPLAYLKNPVYRLIEGDVDGALEALSSPFSEEILFKYLADIARNQKKEGGQVFNKYAPWLYRQEQKAAHLWKGLGPGSALDFQRIIEAHFDDNKAAWPEYVALFGPRIVTMDLKEGLTNNAYDFMEAISASEGARKIFRDAVRGRGPIEDLERARRVTEIQLTYSINEMIADVEAARQHDLSEEQIEKSLSAARVPQWLIGGLLDGATQDIVLHYQELDAGFAEEQEDAN